MAQHEEGALAVAAVQGGGLAAYGFWLGSAEPSGIWSRNSPSSWVKITGMSRLLVWPASGITAYRASGSRRAPDQVTESLSPIWAGIPSTSTPCTGRREARAGRGAVGKREG